MCGGQESFVSKSDSVEMSTPVAKEESYFLANRKQGRKTLPEPLSARSGGVVPKRKAPCSRGSELSSIIPRRGLSGATIRKCMRNSVTWPVA